MEYFDFIERVLHASSLDDLVAASTSITAHHGLDNMGYAVSMRARQNSAGATYYNFNDFSSDWRKTYDALSDGKIAARDARVAHARAGLPSTAWNVDGRIGFTETAIGQLAGPILRKAGDHGISAGITVPVGGPRVNWSFMTFTTDATRNIRDLLPAIPALTYFASCLHVAATRLQGWEEKHPILSEREREVLRWAAIGKSSWEISMILAISERTVNFHVQRAARKLDVRGRRAACARAIALGLIHL